MWSNSLRTLSSSPPSLGNGSDRSRCAWVAWGGFEASGYLVWGQGKVHPPRLRLRLGFKVLVAMYACPRWADSKRAVDDSVRVGPKTVVVPASRCSNCWMCLSPSSGAFGPERRSRRYFGIAAPMRSTQGRHRRLGGAWSDQKGRAAPSMARPRLGRPRSRWAPKGTCAHRSSWPSCCRNPEGDLATAPLCPLCSLLP